MAGSLRSVFSSRFFSGLLQPPCTLCTPLTRFSGARDLSTSSALSKDPNTPKKVGDKGPSKNYNKKMAKKAKAFPKSSDEVPSGNGESGLGSLLMNMKHLEAEEDNNDTPDLDLMNILSGVKVVPVPRREPDTDKRRNINTADPSSLKKCQFLNPKAGPRLDVFNKPRPGVPIKPPGKPSYAEIDAQEKLKNLQMLRPWSHYNDMLENRDVPFPRQFPVDNERYDQGEEANVEFKDHVLLDHHLSNFPKKGPVRHFMELVLTGLSKNPHYNANEKKEIVAWYKEYFDNFTPEQLQATMKK